MGDLPWFDGKCRIAFDRKRNTCRRGSGSRCNVDWDQSVHARNEAGACYASAKARYSDQCVARLDASLIVGIRIKSHDDKIPCRKK